MLFTNLPLPPAASNVAFQVENRIGQGWIALRQRAIVILDAGQFFLPMARLVDSIIIMGRIFSIYFVLISFVASD
jgi:hypothetical protein